MSCLQHLRLPQWGACIIICMFTISAGVSNVHCSDYATLPNILFAHLLMWFHQSKHCYLNYQACAHSIQAYMQAYDEMWITSNRRLIFNWQTTSNTRITSKRSLISDIQIIRKYLMATSAIRENYCTSAGRFDSQKVKFLVSFGL